MVSQPRQILAAAKALWIGIFPRRLPHHSGELSRRLRWSVLLPQGQLPTILRRAMPEFVACVPVDSYRAKPDGLVQSHAGRVGQRDAGVRVVETLGGKDSQERRVECLTDPGWIHPRRPKRPPTTRRRRVRNAWRRRRSLRYLRHAPGRATASARSSSIRCAISSAAGGSTSNEIAVFLTTGSVDPGDLIGFVCGSQPDPRSQDLP